MKVAIIGASGLLGSHLIEVGLALNHEILAVSRTAPLRSATFHYREKITQKLMDISELVASDLKGYDLLINTAANVTASMHQNLVDQNLELVKKVFTVAKEANIPKLVQVSSISTMSNGLGIDEVSETNHGQFRKTIYAESKFKSDLWFFDNFPKSLTVHPCYMLGKWDSKPSSGAILLALQMKRLPGIYPTLKNFVYAGDVARGIYEAVRKDASGRYILGGKNIALDYFFENSVKSLGLDLKLEHISLDQLESYPVFKDFFLTNAVNDQAARGDWGYKSEVCLDEMLTETVAYFRSNKLLPKPKI